MSNWVNNIKCLVRPYITVTGWTVLAIAALILIIKFADREIAMMIIGAFVGSTTTAVGVYIQKRNEENNKGGD